MRQRVVVDLELRPLVGVDRVLDRELVEVELAAHAVELLLGRLVQPEPHERAVALAGLERIRQPELPAFSPLPFS